MIANPIFGADLADRIADLAESTTGVLLVYHVGHGVLSSHGELCLTVSSTRPNRPKITGLPWETIADVLRTSPARTRLAILDCCFAGQAIEALAAEGDPSLADIAHVEGVYTLTATTRNRAAHVPPPGEQDTACTSFTAELRDLIQAGIHGKPRQLTFSDLYPVLRQRLGAKGLPAPSQRGTDTAHQYPFTANAAARIHRTPHDVRPDGNTGGETVRPDPEAARNARSRQARILTAALRSAQLITEPSWRISAFVAIVKAMAATDPDRAARLTTDALHLAQSVTDHLSKVMALSGAAEAVAAIDPDRAERIARSISDEDWREWALGNVSKAVAATDPDRAERIARSITDEYDEAWALARIAKAMAAAYRTAPPGSRTTPNAPPGR